MAYRGWLQLGQTEIANTARTVSYMRSGVRNLTTEIVNDDSWSLLPVWLGRGEQWTTPNEDDDCPWFDHTEPASGEFAGVWPLSVDGLDTTPLDREVVESATVGGGFGVTRVPPRVISVEALLVAATPRGLAYGVQWLGAALRSDSCAVSDDPRDLSFLAAIPPSDADVTAAEIRAMGDEQARMLVDVALTKPLEVEEWFSPWAMENRGACCARVSWEFTAAVPWIWRSPVVLARGLEPAAGDPFVVRFENVDEQGVCPADCPDDYGVLRDPSAPPVPVLPRPVNPAAGIGCAPFEARRMTWTLEAGRISRWAETLPTVTLRAGGRAERSIRVQWFEGQVSGEVKACSALGEAHVAYLSARATLVLDARSGRAEVLTADGRRLDATPVVTGRGGGPWRAPVLRCAQAYTLVVDVEQSASRDLRLDVDGVVRQP